jgi:hypothetical protein
MPFQHPTVLMSVYSDLWIRRSVGLTRWAHSVQLPSYKRLCCVGYPASVKAASIMAAVTPVPQLLMIGTPGFIPLDSKTALSSEAGRRVLSFGSRRSATGTEMEWGMCPEDRPVLVSIP